MLIRFCCHLADTLHYSSIKVHLSAIWSLHIEEGLPSPLVGCLHLQRVLWGVKRHQGSTKRQRQPFTIKLMHIIFQSLNFSDFNHTMLWAACFLGFFGFLRTDEFHCQLPPSIPTSTLLSAMFKQIPWLVQAASGFILSALSQTPFTKVAISTLVLGNVICALYAPLPNIYTSVVQLLAHSSFSLMVPPYIAHS